MYKFLETLLEHASIVESDAASKLLNDPSAIEALTAAAVHDLKSTNANIGDLPMAIVTGQIRSFVDGHLIDKGIRLSKQNLGAVVTKVLDQLRANGQKYNLFDESVNEANIDKARETEDDAHVDDADDSAVDVDTGPKSDTETVVEKSRKTAKK